MMRVAYAFSRAGSIWDKASPSDFVNKVWQKSDSQALHGGSLEVNDECFLGGSL